jgi:4-amino-4-deoxy-L-arabinose transferase-like glycosyltransferase
MNRQTVGKLLLALCSVAWLFAVTLAYYIVHKPFTVENLLAILNALGDVLVAAALFALAAALGRRLTRALRFASPLEALVVHAGIGLAMLSFATLALGWLGWLNPTLFWALLLLSLFLLRADLVSSWRDLRALHLPIDSRFDRALALFCGFTLALAFLLALLPPTAWDAQTYHLVEAKVAIAQGRIAAPPDIVYFSFPSLVEMLYLAAMLLKGDIAAQLIHLCFFLLLLGALFAFAVRYFSARVAWLACAVLVAVPSLVSLATWAYVDLALAFYAFAAFYAAMIAREANDWRGFALAGVCAGLAMGVKYTAAIVPLALLVFIIQPRRLSFVVVFLSFAALFAAPWYLRNWVFTGNPVYPFVFGGRYWDALRAEQFSRFGTGLLNSPLQLLTAPWDATILGSEGAVNYDATIGPLLLALLPLLVLVFHKFQNQILRAALVFSAILYLFWLAGLAESKLLLQTRLLFPAFPTLAVAAAVAFDRLAAIDLPQFSLQRFARLLVLLVLGLTAFSYALGFASVNAFGYLAGFESRDAYLARALGGYYAAVQFVNTLPSNSKTLFLWEPRSYYARRAVQPDAILDAFADRWSHFPAADAFAAELSREGYTHILLNRAGLDYLLQSGYDPIDHREIALLQDLTARDWKQVYGRTPFEIVARDGKPAVLGANNDAYAIYEIVAPRSP